MVKVPKGSTGGLDDLIKAEDLRKRENQNRKALAQKTSNDFGRRESESSINSKCTTEAIIVVG